MKIRFYLFAILSIILIMSGCSNNDNNTQENDQAHAEEEVENDETNNEENEENESNEHDENNNQESDDEVDYREDLGNLEIWFEGKVHVEDDGITVEGESNLLPGTQIHSTGVGENWALEQFRDRVEVGEDGSFRFEFSEYKNEAEVTLRVSTGKEFVADHYGDNLENATGNQVYKTSNKGEYEAKYTFLIDPREETPYTIDLTTPDYENNRPSDYGDSEIWMDVEATTKHNYLYFEGESNLVEGSQINGGISDPENVINSAWSFTNTKVKPDGSFQLHIHYWDLREGMEMEFEVDPASSSWDNVIDAYGEDGEKLEGDLVKRKDDGRKYIKYTVDLAGPEIDAPDEFDLSVEDDEIKIQVPDDVLFDFDKSELKSDAKEKLDEVIDDLGRVSPDVEMKINGHTDNEGDPDYNLELSEDRAHAVADYINETSDLDSLTMDVQGFGETDPIASNEDEDGRSRNRRVEIVINPK